MQQCFVLVLTAMLIASTSAMNFQKRQISNNLQQIAAMLPMSQQEEMPQSDAQPSLLDVVQPTGEPDDSDAQVVPDLDSENVDNSDAVITDEQSVQAVASSSLKSSPIAEMSDASLVPASVVSSSASMATPQDYDWFYPEDVQVFNGFGGMDYDYSLADDSQAAINSSSDSILQVAELDNVFYFNSVSTLIADAESLLAYELQLFGSATFDQYLEEEQSNNNDYDYELIALPTSVSSPTPAATADPSAANLST